MLRVFIGTDRERARAALVRAAGEHASLVWMTPDSFDTVLADSIVHGSGLFGEERALALDGLSTVAESKALLTSVLSRYAASRATVFILEQKPDAEFKRVLAKHAKNLEEFMLEKKVSGGDFALAHAFGNKERAKAWVAYTRALVEGTAPEQLHGMLFWSAKRPSRARTADEARHLIADLASLPGEARRKNVELEYALERFILER